MHCHGVRHVPSESGDPVRPRKPDPGVSFF
jgi:hypothetical protein